LPHAHPPFRSIFNLPFPMATLAVIAVFLRENSERLSRNRRNPRLLPTATANNSENSRCFSL
jgi:hypothetical protein